MYAEFVALAAQTSEVRVQRQEWVLICIAEMDGTATPLCRVRQPIASAEVVSQQSPEVYRRNALMIFERRG